MIIRQKPQYYMENIYILSLFFSDILTLLYEKACFCHEKKKLIYLAILTLFLSIPILNLAILS